MEFATENDKEEIRKRFDRLKPGFQENPQTPTWAGIEEASLALDPDGTQHRRRAADRLGAIACGSDTAPYVTQGLIRNGRLAALRDRVAVARTRMEEGRGSPKKCPGVAGLSEENWRWLEEIKPQ